MPDRVRESLFNILSRTVVDRPFFDLFAGTGAVGFEALSRGASRVTFVERDGRAVAEIQKHLHAFGVSDLAQVLRADVYRWAERWQPPGEPANVFLGPPYPDYHRALNELMLVVHLAQENVAPGSVLVLQSEKAFDPGTLPKAQTWDNRHYGRTQLSIWTKDADV
jgi:16S rRNA (guanine966-N2)-methyltransferase